MRGKVDGVCERQRGWCVCEAVWMVCVRGSVDGVCERQRGWCVCEAVGMVCVRLCGWCV